MTTLYIIRHGQRGESDPSYKRSSTRPDDPDITTIGRQQAIETGKKLATEGISVIYASPFLRTMRTASLIAEQCNVKVRPDWGLAEWFRSDWWKEWPGTISIDVLARIFPQVEIMTPSGIYPELMEDDFWQLHARYVSTAKILADRHLGEKIALVTHGGGVISIPTGLVAWDLPGKDLHRQCGISKIVKQHDQWSVDYLNDVSHLTHVET